MKNERLIAYLLIALGVITLISRIGGADWLWVGIIAVAFLAGYVTRQNYGFLVAGSVLSGVAVGLLLGGSLGATLISVAVGLFVVDRLEPRPNRWPLYAAGILGALGAISGLGETGLLGSVGFALILIAAGAFLIIRERQETARGADRSVPSSPPAPSEPPREPVTVVPPPPATGTDAATTPEPKVVQVDTPEGAASPETSEPELTPEQRERYRRLEAWRRETATAEGTPAYIVLRNESLEQIATQNPRTLDELDKVKGIGPVKLERYGDAILKTLHGEAPAQV